MKTKIEKPEQTIKLSESKGMLKVIAEMELRYADAYYCMVGGKRTKITK